MTNPPLPHQQRVIEEKAQLDERLSKLRVFVHGETFSTLSLAEQKRLMRQLGLMSQLSDVLRERIDAF